MEDLKEFGVTVLAMMLGFFGLAVSFAVLIALMASPFIAIGLGVSFIGWAACLPFSFC